MKYSYLMKRAMIAKRQSEKFGKILHYAVSPSEDLEKLSDYWNDLKWDLMELLKSSNQKIPVTIWDKIKRFRGINLSLFEVSLNDFDGYGFSILNVSYSYIKGITFSNGGSLFHIGLVENTEYKGRQWELKLSVLFYGFTAFVWVVIPRQHYCKTCERYFADLKPEFEPYCSEQCKEKLW